MVCRLVEEQDVGIGKKKFPEGDTGFLSFSTTTLKTLIPIIIPIGAVTAVTAISL